MLTITRDLRLLPGAMQVSTFRGSSEPNLWKRISLTQMPSSARVHVTISPRPEFIPDAELQRKAPPGKHRSQTMGLTEGRLKVKWKDDFQSMWKPDGRDSFRFTNGTLHLELTIRVWLPRQCQPGKNEKDTLMYALAMGHELEHVQDEIEAYQLLTDATLTQACHILRVFCVDGGSGTPRPISQREREDLFVRREPRLVQSRGMVDAVSRFEVQIFNTWLEVKEERARKTDDPAVVFLYSGNVLRLQRGEFGAILWPL